VQIIFQFPVIKD